MRIPDKLINFTVYDGNLALGLADIDLPDIEYMSETLSGAGIAGETETPALGQLASMTTSLNFRTLYEDIGNYLAPRGRMVDVRGSIQHYESGTGELKPLPVKCTMNILPKSGSLGKFATASPTDTSIEGEVTYLKLYINNKLVCEIDKFNYICNINGRDYLEEVRNHLGL